MRISQKINTIKEFFKQLPLKMAEHSFLSFLALFFISLIIGGIMLYKYDITTRKKEIKIEGRLIKLHKKRMENVLESIDKREKNFQEVDFKTWQNPFQKSFVFPGVSTSTQEATSTEEKTPL